ncbi:MAG: TrbI/VirB10 family protein, partial [Variibacter sp.]
MSEIEPEKEKGLEPPGEDGALPLTGEPAAPMRLRPEPPRVTRLSRKVLAGLGLVASVGIGGALIYALQIHGGRKGNEELYATDNRATPDGLNSLPRDYTGPVLGPPLPGDLGRPILNAQNAVLPPSIATPNPGISAEEQRRLQELESARTARLFASTETRSASSRPAATAATPTPDLTNLGLAPQPATPTAQDRQLAFLNQTPDKRTVSPDRVAVPASANVLQAGAVIAAALITGIRSDLPGQITAQVTENIYDSPTGKILLVPQGTRIIGQYDNSV